MPKPSAKPDPRDERPQTIREARALIQRTLNEMPWSKDEQARYFKLKGLTASTVEELSDDEVRAIVKSMEQSRILIF